MDYTDKYFSLRNDPLPNSVNFYFQTPSYISQGTEKLHGIDFNRKAAYCSSSNNTKHK